MSGDVRPWSWGCGGPDAFMEIVLAPVDDATLVQRVGELRGYVSARIEGAMVSSFAEPRAVAGYVAYAEAARADEVFARLRGTSQEALWIYRVVSVGDSRVRFEDGYTSGDAASVGTESRLAYVLATSPDLTVVAWVVRSGGQGYPATTIAEGRDGASLVAHLRPPKSPA